MRLPAFVCGGEDAARTRQNQNYCRAVVRFFFLSGGVLLPINNLPFLTFRGSEIDAREKTKPSHGK